MPSLRAPAFLSIEESEARRAKDNKDGEKNAKGRGNPAFITCAKRTKWLLLTYKYMDCRALVRSGCAGLRGLAMTVGLSELDKSQSNSISPSEFDVLMKDILPSPLSPPFRLAVAVSGGPDSLALSLLTQEWAQSYGGTAIALTIDHRLRDKSTEEAHQVKAWLEAWGMEHHILTWEGTKPQSAIQAKAREARYGLLEQWCSDHEVAYLLTAHHAQDQLETFLIRLSKGSGLKGLTGIQGAVKKEFGWVLRPLLAQHPDRLKETLKIRGQCFIQDPSNDNLAFTRVKWRKHLPDLAEHGLTPDHLGVTLARLSQAQRLIDHFMRGVFDQYVQISPFGHAIIDQAFLLEPNDVIEEILKATVELVVPRKYPLRQASLQEATSRLKTHKNTTLGGCQLLKKQGAFWIIREFSSIHEDIEVLHPGVYRWDNRFEVSVSQPDCPCRISPLGDHGISLMDSRPEHIRYEVLKTLPALWNGEKLLNPFPTLHRVVHHEGFLTRDTR